MYLFLYIYITKHAKLVLKFWNQGPFQEDTRYEKFSHPTLIWMSTNPIIPQVSQVSGIRLFCFGTHFDSLFSAYRFSSCLQKEWLDFNLVKLPPRCYMSNHRCSSLPKCVGQSWAPMAWVTHPTRMLMNSSTKTTAHLLVHSWELIQSLGHVEQNNSPVLAGGACQNQVAGQQP